MRYRTDEAWEAMAGQTRTVRKFLWLPRSFRGDQEGRWLEWALIVERVEKRPVALEMGYLVYDWRWWEVGFAPESARP